jgi:hypothetical protein
MNGFAWSAPARPNGDCAYDHITAETPLGVVRIEWKGWKAYDAPTAQMPWGEFVGGHDLETAKAAVEQAWRRMAATIAAFTAAASEQNEREA